MENHSSVMAVDRISNREERKQKQHKRRKTVRENPSQRKQSNSAPATKGKLKATGLHKNKQ